MPTNWLAPICTSEEGTGARIRLHLVDDQSRQIELFSHLSELAKVCAKLLLAFAQLSTAMEVDSEVGHDAVHYLSLIHI